MLTTDGTVKFAAKSEIRAFVVMRYQDSRYDLLSWTRMQLFNWGSAPRRLGVRGAGKASLEVMVWPIRTLLRGLPAALEIVERGAKRASSCSVTASVNQAVDVSDDSEPPPYVPKPVRSSEYRIEEGVLCVFCGP